MGHLFVLLGVVLIMIYIAARMTSAETATSSVACDFEAGMCGWYSESSRGYIFHRHSGSTADRTSGPDTDHTLPDSPRGHYIYTTGWEAKGSGDIASLLSPPLTLPHPATLSLWYQMNGHGVGDLSLYIYQLTRGGGGGTGGGNATGGGRSGASLLWTVQGRQGLRWRQRTTALHSGRWQLEIRTSARHPYGADIAIDDISLFENPKVTTTSQTHHTQITASTTWTGTSSMTNVINNVISTSPGPGETTEGKKTSENSVKLHPESSGSPHGVSSGKGPSNQVRGTIVGVCIGLMGLGGMLAAIFVYKRVFKKKIHHLDGEQPEEKKDNAAPTTGDVEVQLPPTDHTLEK